MVPVALRDIGPNTAIASAIAGAIALAGGAMASLARALAKLLAVALVFLLPCVPPVTDGAYAMHATMAASAGGCCGSECSCGEACPCAAGTDDREQPQDTAPAPHELRPKTQLIHMALRARGRDAAAQPGMLIASAGRAEHARPAGRRLLSLVSRWTT